MKGCEKSTITYQHWLGTVKRISLIIVCYLCCHSCPTDSPKTNKMRLHDHAYLAFRMKFCVCGNSCDLSRASLSGGAYRPQIYIQYKARVHRTMIRRAYIRLGRVRSAVKFLGSEQDAVRPARYALLRARVVRVSAPVKFVG